MHPVIKTLGTSYQETVPTLVSVIWRNLEIIYIITLYMKNKFERELDEEIPEEIWYHMWITHQQHNHWNWGNLVGRTRFLTLMLQITSKQTNTKQSCWKLWKCGHMEPNHTHIWENKTGIHSALGKLGERLGEIYDSKIISDSILELS